MIDENYDEEFDVEEEDVEEEKEVSSRIRKQEGKYWVNMFFIFYVIAVFKILGAM